MMLLHFKYLKISTKVSEAVSLLSLFKWKKRKVCFWMNPLYFSSENFLSSRHLLCAWAPSQLCQRPMVCFDSTSLLPGQSLLPSQAQKSRRKYKSSLALPPTAAFNPMLVHDLNLASRLIHDCNNKSSQANRLRSRKTQDGFMRCI